MRECRDARQARLEAGDDVRRVGKLRTGAARPLERVVRVSVDGRYVYLQSEGEGVRVREWVSTRVVEKKTDDGRVLGALGG